MGTGRDSAAAGSKAAGAVALQAGRVGAVLGLAQDEGWRSLGMVLANAERDLPKVRPCPAAERSGSLGKDVTAEVGVAARCP